MTLLRQNRAMTLLRQNLLMTLLRQNRAMTLPREAPPRHKNRPTRNRPTCCVRAKRHTSRRQ